MRATQTPPAARKYSVAPDPMSSAAGELFPREDLLPGDVLLSCGCEALSILITRLDGGRYSHSAVWDGNFAIDAGRTGFRQSKLEDDMNEQWFMDAYRWHSPPPQSSDLGDGQYPAQPVVNQCDGIVQAGTRFAYDELVMLAVVISVSREPADKWLRQSVRRLLSRVEEWIHDHVTTSPGTKVMTCAESVVRSFDEAQPTRRYELEIQIDPKRDYSAVAAAAQASLGIRPPTPSSSYEALRQRYAGLVLSATQQDTKTGLQQIAANLDREGAFMAGAPDLPPGCVTPGDLQKSPSLRYLGRLSQHPAPPTASQSSFRLFLAVIWEELLRRKKTLSRS